MPIWRYSSWCVRGSSTASRISCFWMSSPPMSYTMQSRGNSKTRGPQCVIWIWGQGSITRESPALCESCTRSTVSVSC